MISSNGLTHHPWCLQGALICCVCYSLLTLCSCLYVRLQFGPAFSHPTPHIAQCRASHVPFMQDVCICIVFNTIGRIDSWCSRCRTVVATHCLKNNMRLRHTPYNQYMGGDYSGHRGRIRLDNRTRTRDIHVSPWDGCASMTRWTIGPTRGAVVWPFTGTD